MGLRGSRRRSKVPCWLRGSCCVLTAVSCIYRSLIILLLEAASLTVAFLVTVRARLLALSNMVRCAAVEALEGLASRGLGRGRCSLRLAFVSRKLRMNILAFLTKATLACVGEVATNLGNRGVSGG